MDAKDLLRRYLEQRRELGESELVLDGLNVDDVMRLLGGGRLTKKKKQTQRSVREMAGTPYQDWRESLRDAGVNVDAALPAPAISVEPPPEPTPTRVEIPNDMAFKKGIVIPSHEAELLPGAIEKLRSLDEIAEQV